MKQTNTFKYPNKNYLVEPYFLCFQFPNVINVKVYLISDSHSSSCVHTSKS